MHQSDVMSTSGGYHGYIEGNVMSTSRDVQNIGGIS